MDTRERARRYAQHDGAAPTWYEARALTRPAWPALDGDVRADVCVIGGGYTGLSCALHLAERGYDTLLLEARRIGNGASGRNGGQLGSGHRRDQSALERELGAGQARLLWSLAEDAKALVRARIARHGIACDLKPGIAIAAHRPRYARALAREAERLREIYGYGEIDVLDRAGMRAEVDSEDFCGGLLDRGAGHLHPLDYALGLARAAADAGVDIREGTPVTGLAPGAPCRVRAGPHTVSADAVVLACNGYLDALDPGIGGGVMPINNFILATEPLGEERARALIPRDVAVVDTRFVVNYFRLSADRRPLRRRREGEHAPPGRSRPPRAALHAAHLPAARRCARRPCLGRHSRHHLDEDAEHRQAAGRALLRARLFGPRRGARDAWRRAGGRGDLRHARALRRLRPAAAPAVPRRRAPALADARARARLRRAARPAVRGAGQADCCTSRSRTTMARLLMRLAAMTPKATIPTSTVETALISGVTPRRTWE